MNYSVSKKLLFSLLLVPLSYTTPIKSEAYLFSSALSFVSGTGLILSGLSLKNGYKNLLITVEEQLIKDWIAENNLNQYGEPQETIYSQDNPLAPDQSRIDYIKNKYPKKPWFKGYKKMIKPISGTLFTPPVLIVSGIMLLYIGIYFGKLALNQVKN